MLTTAAAPGGTGGTTGVPVTVIPFSPLPSNVHVIDERGMRAYATLLDLAAELGLPDLTDPERIRTALVLQRCERESRLRQLENRNELLRTMQIPTLEGELRAAEIDRNEWAARAKDFEVRAIKAETRVLKLLAGILGGLVMLAAVITFAGAVFS